MSQHKTWEDECLPQMRILGDGPTALCVLWKVEDVVSRGLPTDLHQVGVVGNLYTPLGISWLLRGLWHLNQVKRVVVWGSDLTRSGEALIRLWQDGVADGHKVPEFGWRLDELIPVEAIDELRRTVEIVDCRSYKRLGDTASILRQEVSRETRVTRTFPPVPVPELQFWSSDRSMTHVDAPDIGSAWLKVLQVVMHAGQPRETRKKERIAHFFDVVVSFPVPDREEVHPCFDFSPSDLEDYARQVLSPDRPEDIDYWYGERIQNWRGHNQLEEVIGRLKKAPDTKRATIALLEAPDLEELEDAPCFTTATFSIIDGKLYGSYVFRSHDMYWGWPFNIYSIIRLHRRVAEEVGVGLGRATFHSQNAQIYERYWDRAMEKLHKFGPSLNRPGEFLRVKGDPAGNFVFTITDQNTVRCAYMNYTHDQIIWEKEHRDPGVIIGLIAQSMPWLDSHHLVYLGVEKEKLARSLRTGEKYVQG